MYLYKAFSECLTGRPKESTSSHLDPVEIKYSDKELEPGLFTTEDTADSFVHALCTAEKNGQDLKDSLDNIVHTYGGWTERLAKAILEKLEAAFKAGQDKAPAIREALEKAAAAAVEFPKEHPVYTTIIALGVLVALAPWVIEALGFGELGPVSGTFASWWQARFAGYVPKDSLFSFFQRLGMVWRRLVKGVQLEEHEVNVIKLPLEED